MEIEENYGGKIEEMIIEEIQIIMEIINMEIMKIKGEEEEKKRKKKIEEEKQEMMEKEEIEKVKEIMKRKIIEVEMKMEGIEIVRILQEKKKER